MRRAHRKRGRSRRERLVPLLPNVLTTVGLSFGLLAVLFSMQAVVEAAGGPAGAQAAARRFWWAALFICAAGLLDMLDGRLARLLKTHGGFGMHYDSLSDLVSFGIAPAVLVYGWALAGAGKAGLMAVVIYVVCAALRLARFNVQSTTVERFWFLGLPTPAAAALMITPVFLLAELSQSPGERLMWYYQFMAPVFGFLMVSEIRYPKMPGFSFRMSFNSLVVAAILIAAVISNPEALSVVFAYAYGVSGLARYLYFQLARGGAKESEKEKEVAPGED